MAEIVFQKTIPILRIFDVEKAKAFYIDFLGFTLDWQHRFAEDLPIYMQLSRGSFVLHLSEHHGDCCPGAKIFIEMAGIDTFHQEISAKGYQYMRPGIEETFYQARCMEVTDPFGNRLSFNERFSQSKQQQEHG